MLVKIEKREAFDMIMDPEQIEKVYFKHKEGYAKVEIYKWTFTHTGRNGGVMDFVKTEFYKEIDIEEAQQ